MTRAQLIRLVWVGIVMLIPAATAAAQGVDQAAHTEMSVDVSITHTVLDEDGNLVLPVAMPTVFTLTRSRRGETWRTTMTYRKQTGVPTKASAHPLDGARVEFDEASGATRVYDSAGELNALLSNDSTSGLAAPQNSGQWLEGLVASADGRSARSRGLEEMYGKAVGRVRGLDRFLTTREEGVEEVLADPRSALPLEINTVRDGVLQSHIVFDYDRRADGTWIRRSMRAEQVVPGAGHRTRTTVEFANVSMVGR